jgi:hypothetical protein
VKQTGETVPHYYYCDVCTDFQRQVADLRADIREAARSRGAEMERIFEAAMTTPAPISGLLADLLQAERLYEAHRSRNARPYHESSDIACATEVLV